MIIVEVLKVGQKDDTYIASIELEVSVLQFRMLVLQSPTNITFFFSISNFSGIGLIKYFVNSLTHTLQAKS